MQMIATSEELAALCARMAEKDYITVDTEFLRERTFWPQLCLIQTAAIGIEAIIDPLADGIELAPFYALLANPNIIKVMHGCRQDIEIFHHEADCIPAPLFDTQIAAMVCGFGDAVSYQELVRRTTQGKIDKGSRFTDWSARPLSPEQLDYALADVTHLRDAYEKLRDEVEKGGRAEWIADEMAALSDRTLYEPQPEMAWQRLKLQNLRPSVLGALVELAAWRERCAQEKNVPRGRILRDDALRELATQRPKDKAALTRMRALPRGFAQSRYADDILAAIARGNKTPPDDLPEQASPVHNRPGIAALVELMRVLLKQRCAETGVAPKLLASSDDLKRIASDDAPDVAALHGWRAEIFGDYALKLKSGELALACEGDKVLLVPRAPSN